MAAWTPTVSASGLAQVPGGEGPVSAGAAPAGGAAVDDVVVDQGEGVEDLQARRRAPQGLLAVVTAGGVPAEDAQQGPDAFAGCQDEIGQGLGQFAGAAPLGRD